MLCLRTNAHFNNGHKFYKFEKILDGTCNQVETFQQCNIAQMTRCFVRQGRNCNVLVYGPTNSGKTYTMIGNCPTLYQARKSSSRSPTPRKVQGPSFTDNKKRSKSNPRLRPISSFVNDLEQQKSRGRVPAPGLLLKNSSQNENRSLDRTSQCSNRLSCATPLKQICDSDTGGIIPRAIKQIVCEYQRYQDGFVRQNFILKMSVVEIYNDVISDLLGDGDLFTTNMCPQAQKSQMPQIKELNINGNGPRIIVQNV